MDDAAGSVDDSLSAQAVSANASVGVAALAGRGDEQAGKEIEGAGARLDRRSAAGAVAAVPAVANVGASADPACIQDRVARDGQASAIAVDGRRSADARAAAVAVVSESAVAVGFDRQGVVDVPDRPDGHCETVADIDVGEAAVADSRNAGHADPAIAFGRQGQGILEVDAVAGSVGAKDLDRSSGPVAADSAAFGAVASRRAAFAIGLEVGTAGHVDECVSALGE